MASEDLDGSDDEGHKSFQPVQPPAKRRKIDSSDYGTDAELDSTGEGDPFASFSVLAPNNVGTENKENEDVEKAKNTSKHKIHIPKNPELPTDAFFTQPPQRSSSPYRIDQFHWRKPRKSSP